MMESESQKPDFGMAIMGQQNGINVMMNGLFSSPAEN